MIAIHDSTVQAYAVDFEIGTLTIKTTYQAANVFTKTNVLFSGYLAHFFENEMKGSIIFDIQEYPFELFFKNESALIEQRKHYSWPIHYETINELIQYLQTHKYKIFEISSSIGLCGLVFAKKNGDVMLRNLAEETNETHIEIANVLSKKPIMK